MESLHEGIAAVSRPRAKVESIRPDGPGGHAQGGPLREPERDGLQLHGKVKRWDGAGMPEQ